MGHTIVESGKKGSKDIKNGDSLLNYNLTVLNVVAYGTLVWGFAGNARLSMTNI